MRGTHRAEVSVVDPVRRPPRTSMHHLALSADVAHEPLAPGFCRMNDPDNIHRIDRFRTRKRLQRQGLGSAGGAACLRSAS